MFNCIQNYYLSFLFVFFSNSMSRVRVKILLLFQISSISFQISLMTQIHWHCIFPSLLAVSQQFPVFRNSSSLVSQLGSFPVLSSFLQYWSQVNHRYESNHLIYQCLPDHWQIVQICLMCLHSYSRCLVVSVSPHLEHFILLHSGMC